MYYFKKANKYGIFLMVLIFIGQGYLAARVHSETKIHVT